MENNKDLTFDQIQIRIRRLLDLIDGANQSIEIEKEISSEYPSMIKQYVHLRQQYVDQLTALLNEHHIFINTHKAA